MTQNTFFHSTIIVILTLVSALGLLNPCGSSAAEAADMGGWEKNSPYNRLYNPSEMDRIKGTIEKISETPPLPGMSPGVILRLRQSDSETTDVHVCPAWYMDSKSTGLKKGDEVKIRGAWAEVGGNFVFMASKIKKGDFFELKVRLTKDGTPFWTMTPEELEREKAEQ